MRAAWGRLFKHLVLLGAMHSKRVRDQLCGFE